tara:strand:- start:2794 stop:3750 length:957 start_codon:yes stop_codon:yes gene_type:complete
MSWEAYDPIRKMATHYEGQVRDDGVLIPTTDEVAWKHYWQHNWIYNKLEVAESQGLDCGIVPTEPTEFPVVVKPIYNLMGGSINVQVCHNMEEYNKIVDPGCFWSPFHFGEHQSLDLILLDGKIVEMFSFHGEKLQFGAFDLWSLNDDNTDDDLLELVEPWVNEFMSDYTGCLNLEVIGDYIIEGQLRMGDIDRFGDHELMQAIWTLHNEHRWEYKRNVWTPTEFYLAALFAQPNKHFNINFELFDYIVGDALVYYQIDDPNMYHTNPPHGNRVAIFCDYELDNVIWARNICAGMMKPDIDGKYLQPLTGYKELSYSL